MWSICETLMLS